MHWWVMDKKQITVLLVALAAVALAALNYFGLIKLPTFLELSPKRSQSELLNDFKADLAAGKLINIAGTIVKINSKVITIATGGDKKEQDITLADNIIIRRLSAPEIKSEGGLTPMIETFITVKDLRVGDNVFANLKNGAAVMLDIMPSSR